VLALRYGAVWYVGERDAGNYALLNSKLTGQAINSKFAEMDQADSADTAKCKQRMPLAAV